MSLSKFAATNPNPGVTRRVRAEAPELMVVSFRFEPAPKENSTAICMCNQPSSRGAAFSWSGMARATSSARVTVSSFQAASSMAAAASKAES